MQLIFESPLMMCAKYYKNWLTCVKAIASQTWDIFCDRLYKSLILKYQVTKHKYSFSKLKENVLRSQPET